MSPPLYAAYNVTMKTGVISLTKEEHADWYDLDAGILLHGVAGICYNRGARYFLFGCFNNGERARRSFFT